jgi:hypothetical protein
MSTGTGTSTSIRDCGRSICGGSLRAIGSPNPGRYSRSTPPRHPGHP